MANPRATISFEEIDAHYTTFKIDASTITYDGTKPGGSSAVGLAVTLSADDTVALTADGDAVTGKLAKVEDDGFCSVQDRGYATLPGGNGATLTRGASIVGALGTSSAKGYVRSVNTAVAAELGKCKHTLTNVGTPASAWVKLD